MPLALLLCWLMIVLRATGIILVFPTFGTTPLPVTVRVGLALMVATLLYGIVPHAAFAHLGYGSLAVAAAGEVVLGLAMGFIGRLIFEAVEMAGRIIVTEIGLVAGPGFDVPTPAGEPLPSFYYMFAGVMFFLLGGHFGVLQAFARSFDFSAAGSASFGPHAIESIVLFTGISIDLGVRIAAPFIALNFLVTLAFSILGRAVPKMGVFVMSFPMRVLLGMALLAGSGALLSRYLVGEFGDLPVRLLQILPTH